MCLWAWEKRESLDVGEQGIVFSKNEPQKQVRQEGWIGGIRTMLSFGNDKLSGRVAKKTKESCGGG
jgi:hypothetical protein